MKVTLWGTRGSVARSGPETVIFGGDTSAVEVRGTNGEIVIIDAGSGLSRIGAVIEDTVRRVDILLSHLHLDHIQGLGFFQPLFEHHVTTHVWGPVSATMHLKERLSRYLSPPLFPVRLRDLPALQLHDVEPGTWWIGPFSVTADPVCHPGPTLGFRISEGDYSIAYLSDHEPALGNPAFPSPAEWTSGYKLASGVDLLIHDSQYTDDEYAERVGWGHSTLEHALAFAELCGVETFVTFHHDPDHSDAMLYGIFDAVTGERELPFRVVPGTAGATFDLD